MDKNTKTIITIAVVAVLAAVAYFVLTQPDQRTLGEKVSDAVEQVEEGELDNAARELEDRTPAEEIVDEIEDATDSETE